MIQEIIEGQLPYKPSQKLLFQACLQQKNFPWPLQWLLDQSKENLRLFTFIMITTSRFFKLPCGNSKRIFVKR